MRCLRAGSILVAIATIQSVAPTVAAAREGSDSTRAAATHVTVSASAREPAQTVTLITGDKVTVTPGPNGRDAITTSAATRRDGSRPGISITRNSEDMYAVPEDVQALLAADRVDRELFNVSYLLENGYNDSAVSKLPVIMTFSEELAAKDQRRSVQALHNASEAAVLESIDATAASVDKQGAAAFWSSLAGSGRQRSLAEKSRLAQPISKIWLDRRVAADLHQSVPMIGAPTAWNAGFDGAGVRVAVLDSGIDKSHPDLVGQVVESTSLVPGVDVTDRNGHGTHVASTIAGTGQDGSHRGVAPRAGLVIGKVLDDEGMGQESWIIDGMEWAATRADVVNMSLGTTGGDGTNPLSLAVNRLTEETGALFVVSAGNKGSQPRAIGSPGDADAALTVAAVDKDDHLAGFSSRGPRLGGGLKPDISAPGVSIEAALASGTDAGNPVDGKYTRLSGTSMAAPHVAGAAALLAQQHPGWSPSRLKAALMSTAKDDGYTAYEQGAGRVDLAAAVTTNVFATTANLDFGTVPHADRGTRTVPITFANDGRQPIDLRLTASLRAVGNAPTPPGSVTVDPSLTIPAGASATATVTLEAAALESGRYSGAVTAKLPTGAELRVPIGLAIGPKLHPLTVIVASRQKDADSVPETDCTMVGVFALSDGLPYDRPLCWQGSGDRSHSVTIDVPAGSYFVTAFARWSVNSRAQEALLIRDEVTVQGPTKALLDADRAEPITVTTPRPAETEAQYVYLVRTAESGEFREISGDNWYGRELGWITPTAKPTKGRFVFTSQLVRAAPRLEMTVKARTSVSLHPYAGYLGNSLPFSGTATLPVVYAGRGTAEELSKAQVRGKLVVLRLEDPSRPALSTVQLERVRAAGAAGVLFHPEKAQLQYVSFGDFVEDVPQIPYALIPAAEADELIGQLGHGRVEIRLRATRPGESPYVYSLKPYELNGVPSRLRYSFNAKNLSDLDLSLPATRPDETRLAWATYRPSDLRLGAAVYEDVTTPRRLTLSVGPMYADAVNQLGVNDIEGYYAMDKPVKFSVAAGAPPITAGVPAAPLTVDLPADARRWFECSGCRQGNTFTPFMSMVTPAGHVAGAIGAADDADVHLHRDGVEVPKAPPAFGSRLNYALPPQQARYRLTSTTDQLRATWDFTSGQVTKDETPDGFACLRTFVGGSKEPCRPDPLLFLRFDAGLDLGNTVSSSGVRPLKVTAYRQSARGPEIRGLKIWISTDRGAHWHAVPVIAKHPKAGARDFVALTRYAGGKGTAISLKAEAWDAVGNKTQQVLLDAYGCR